METKCSGTAFTRRTGDDFEEATYARLIKPGEEILLGAGQRFRVVDVVPFEEEDESPSLGCCRLRLLSFYAHKRVLRGYRRLAG